MPPDQLDLATLVSGVSDRLQFIILTYLILRWLGIKVDQSWTYKASLYFKFPVKSPFFGKLTLSLKSSGGSILAQESTIVRGSQTEWKQIQLNLKPTRTAVDTDNIFTVTLDGRAASGQTVDFALLSLFPPTFKNRPNGMRIDIAEVSLKLASHARLWIWGRCQTLSELKPGIFRFPGGNNLVSDYQSLMSWTVRASWLNAFISGGL